MAPKKKKKAKANPARGFSTTSVPSKPKEAIDIETELSKFQPATYKGHAEASKIPRPELGLEPVSPSLINTLTPEELETYFEDARLHSILEVHGARSKTEANKQLVRLLTEHRSLRAHATSFPTVSWLSTQVIDDIVQLHLSESGKKHSSAATATGNVILEDVTDLIVRLWTLEQVLMALMITDTVEVLAHVLSLTRSHQVNWSKDYIWGLEEALEWCVIHGHLKDLPLHELHPQTSTSSAQGSQGGNVKSQPPNSEQHFSSQTTTVVVKSGDESEAIGDSGSDQDDDDENDPDELVPRYIEIMSFLHRAQHDGKLEAHPSKIRRSQQRLEKIQADVLFDHEQAALRWREHLPTLYSVISTVSNSKEIQRTEQIPVMVSRKADTEAQPVTAADALEGSDNDGSFLSGIFATAEAWEAAEDSKSDDIQLLDFGKWSGVHPRRLLEEVCKVHDENRISLIVLSSTVYSNRHALEIQLSEDHPEDQFTSSTIPPEVSYSIQHNLLKLEMKLIASTTLRDSEAYICTIALFIVSIRSPQDQRVSARLPSVWRDLWNTLALKRQAAIAVVDKEALRRVQALIDASVDNLKPQTTSSDAFLHTEANFRVNSHSASVRNLVERLDSSSAKERWMTCARQGAHIDMLKVRAQLPIYEYKQDIISCISRNAITIICAETGAGKSTQVPSFILERNLSSGHDCRIFVSQPRRVSAMSLARRVSHELGEPAGDLGSPRSFVGFAVRLETKVSQATRITFATTGVLLRMLESSRDLDVVDYLILDEVHERTLDLDLLFVAIRQIQERRPGLKVVLMSATVDSDKLSAYFGEAPVLSIPGRSFPVDVLNLEDAIEAFGDQTKVKIEPSEPASADEADSDSEFIDRSTSLQKSLEGYSARTRAILESDYDEHRINFELIADLIFAISSQERYAKFSKAIMIFMPGIAEIRRLERTVRSRPAFHERWVIHLLHSSFSSEEVECAFAPAPRGARKLVISTNIAETGVTIPDVTAVIDSCKEKVMLFDERRQVSRLVEGFISRASSRQRMGRAGRVQEGLYVRLVTRHRYENLMTERHVPEILRLGLQEAIMRILLSEICGSIGIQETFSRFLDVPTPKNIRRATEKLKEAQVLTASETLTPLGRLLAKLPVDVAVGKLLIFGALFNVLVGSDLENPQYWYAPSYDADFLQDPAVTIASILTSSRLYSGVTGDKNSQAYKIEFDRRSSDLLLSFAVYQGWKKATLAGKAREFCRRHSVQFQALVQVEDQKAHLLLNLVEAGLIELDKSEASAIKSRPNGAYSGNFAVIPARYNAQSLAENDNIICSIIAAAFYPRLLVREKKIWRNVSTNQQMRLRPGSANNLIDKAPRFLSFYQAMQTKGNSLQAVETSMVPEPTILTLLGEAEFRIFSGVCIIDSGRLRFSMERRTLLALQLLRKKLQQILSRQIRCPRTPLSASDRRWLEIWQVIMRQCRDTEGILV